MVWKIRSLPGWSGWGQSPRYPLHLWNEALSRAVGRNVFCPSYRALERRLEEAVRSGN